MEVRPIKAEQPTVFPLHTAGDKHVKSTLLAAQGATRKIHITGLIISASAPCNVSFCKVSNSAVILGPYYFVQYGNSTIGFAFPHTKTMDANEGLEVVCSTADVISVDVFGFVDNQI